MTDIFTLNNLISSLSEAVNKLEEARNKGNKEEFNEAKLLIFDLHKKLNEAFGR